MAGYKVSYSLSLLLTISLVSAGNDYPRVTLKHGGILSGRSVSVGSKTVDQFLGVRYAKAPVGSLRFKKPEPADSWTGEVVVRNSGSPCIQPEIASNLTDINVPRGVGRRNKKPVMVWIHGGGYFTGSAAAYIGAPLARQSDVIIVAINYRLNMFGFMSESLGTGNFGLWDQRAAIQWVKDNIAEFGGDPNSITIFGESAGGGSVAAQMMGQHNDGLFQRGIIQSGTLYTPWGWFASDKQRIEKIETIKQKFSCGDLQIYECLRNHSANSIWSKLYNPSDLFLSPWHPVPDGDFFSADVEEESYSLAKRYDLLAGFNEQEGAMTIMFELAIALSKRNESLMNGVSLDAATEYLKDGCSRLISPQSPELCADFLIKIYGVNLAADNKDRAVRLSYVAGELNYNADTVNLLNQHSNRQTKTYAYMFTPYVNFSSDAMPLTAPAWLKKSATHIDELPYLFGAAYLDSDLLLPAGNISDPLLNIFKATRQHADKSYYSIMRNVMKMWSNFAKSGNPNRPTRLWGRAPNWPEFDKEGQQFMQIGEKNNIIDTPHKERLDKLQQVLFPVRTRRVKSEKISSV